MIGNGRSEQRELPIVPGLHVPGVPHPATERAAPHHAPADDDGCKHQGLQAGVLEPHDPSVQSRYDRGGSGAVVQERPGEVYRRHGGWNARARTQYCYVHAIMEMCWLVCL